MANAWRYSLRVPGSKQQASIFFGSPGAKVVNNAFWGITYSGGAIVVASSTRVSSSLRGRIPSISFVPSGTRAQALLRGRIPAVSFIASGTRVQSSPRLRAPRVSLIPSGTRVQTAPSLIARASSTFSSGESLLWAILRELKINSSHFYGTSSITSSLTELRKLVDFDGVVEMVETGPQITDITPSFKVTDASQVYTVIKN